jgi:hypothetical protein
LGLGRLLPLDHLDDLVRLLLLAEVVDVPLLGDGMNLCGAPGSAFVDA